MNKYYELTDYGDSERKILDIDIATNKDKIWTIGNNDAHLDYAAEARESDGWDPTHSIRRIAHMDLGTVRMLAKAQHDEDAISWLETGDSDARDRLIEKYPLYFKACSGGI